MDPYSGGILAMANYPSYFPEYWTDELKGESDVSNVGVFRNLAIGGNYEPGSVMKPITISMALNEGLVNPSTTYEDNGPVVYSGFPVRTWNNKYLGTITMTQILEHSINTGAAWVGHRVGFETFAKYIDAFNFGSPTGIDLQGENTPALRERKDWREIDLATASFGQGIAATPIQILSAVSAIANKGELYQPQVVDKILEDSQVVEIKPIRKGRPISAKTAEIVTEMMIQAVEKGEAKWARPQNWRIAGKTGTAQIPIAGHYDPEKTIASFVGFAPADNPAFVMLVALREPKTSPWGSETAAPLWFEIAKDIFKLWRIPPG